MKIAGLALVVLGLILVVWGAFGFKTRETVVDIGPIQATREKTHDMPYAPISGAVLLIGGVVLMVAGRRA